MNTETIENIFFHIDVNSAFLSWTAVRKLRLEGGVDLRTVPAIIGGDSENRHGIVLAKSIPAGKLGIKTADTIQSALQKCPNLIIEPPDGKFYSAQSHALMDYLRTVCPEIEQVSVDECYMNFTPVADRYESPEAAAHLIKDTVRERFGFTVNVGISDRKVLAKMASDFQKPDRVHTLYRHEIATKMWPLPIEELFMCGRSSAETLRKLDIRTIGDLAHTDLSILRLHLKSYADLLYSFAIGEDHSTVSTEHEDAKGVGNSTTVAKDITDENEAYVVLHNLAESVGSRLRRISKRCSQVTTEIRYSDFKTVSRQKSIRTPTDSNEVICRASQELFHELWNGGPIRLLGIRTTKLTDADEPIQLSLFDEEEQVDERRKALDQALDSIRDRFGKNAVIRGSNLPTDHK